MDTLIITLLASFGLGSLTLFLVWINWRILKISKHILEVSVELLAETITIRVETIKIREISEQVHLETIRMRKALGDVPAPRPQDNKWKPRKKR
mgnify:CR=1 FL=1